MRAAPFGVFAGGPPRRGRPPRRAGRHRQPRGRGHLRRAGRRGRRRRRDGRRRHGRGDRGRPVRRPGGLLDRPLAAPRPSPPRSGPARRPARPRLMRERAVRSAVVIGGYPWMDLAPEAVGLAFGAFALGGGDFRTPCSPRSTWAATPTPPRRSPVPWPERSGGARGVPEEWAAAIGPVRGSCLPVDGGLPRRGHRRVAHAVRQRRPTRRAPWRPPARCQPPARTPVSDERAEQPHRPAIRAASRDCCWASPRATRPDGPPPGTARRGCRSGRGG